MRISRDGAATFHQGKFPYQELLFAYPEGYVQVQTLPFLPDGYPVAAVSIAADHPKVSDFWPPAKQLRCRSATAVRLHLQIEHLRSRSCLPLTIGMVYRR